jgi:phosphatidylinositol alpha-mannosyltransferase
MAAGATVLASDLPAFRRVLEGGRCGALFANGDADDLATRLVALLDDAVARSQLGDAARSAVRRYDWSTVAEQVLRVYETVVEGSR